MNLNHLLEYLESARGNLKINNSPYMDMALLNLWELLKTEIYDPFFFDAFEIGDCGGCKWKGRHQKCSCCRRNRYMRDLKEV